MLIIPANSASAAGGYAVDNSCRFNGTNDYMQKTGSAGSRREFTISFWMKGGSPGGGTIFSTGDYDAGDGVMQISVSNSGRLTFDDFDQDNDSYNQRWVTPGTTNFKDPAAWYHICVAVDSTQSTYANRVKFYLNGENISSLFTNNAADRPVQNADFHINYAKPHTLGRRYGDENYFPGYISEFCLIDGTTLDPTSFGEFDEDSGIWKPIDVSGLTFGTNGFYLDFEDSANLGNDANGGTDFTENNLTAIDQTTDTPTNNFATMNPLFYQSATAVTYSNGNCTTSSPTTGGTAPVSTIEVPKTGKWYCEIKVDSTTGTISDHSRIGIAVPLASNSSNPTYNARYLSNGNYTLDASGAAYGATFAATDIIGIAVDSDSNTIEFYKNGVSQGSLSYTMQSNETYFFTASEASNTIGINYSYNFGNPPFTISSGNADDNGHGNFEYLPPSGYLSLCTKNLSEILS